MSASSVTTYVTALSFVNKLRYSVDPTSSFIVKKMLAGLQRRGRKPDIRMPITYDILPKLIHPVESISPSIYQRRLYKAMFLLAFSAFLRIGEICPSKIADSNNVLQLSDCSFISKASTLESVTISISNCKHNTSRRPFLISIPIGKNLILCPVRALKAYLLLRGTHKGPLFCFKSIPVTRQVFCAMLKYCVTWAGLESKLYTTHSFRIGAASSCAAKGMSNSEIQRLGRWQSDAFKRYIRIPVHTFK